MFTNNIIRQMNQQSRELRALKSRQTIPGDSIQTSSMRNEFPTTITLGNVANARVALCYAQVYGHAVSIDARASVSDIGLTSFNLQVKRSEHGWDNPMPPTTPDADGEMEQRTANISLGADGSIKISLYVVSNGQILGDGGNQHGQLPTRSFQASIISVGTTGFVIDRIVGRVIYNVIYQSHSSQQVVNFDYT